MGVKCHLPRLFQKDILSVQQWKGTYKINTGGSHGYSFFVSSHLPPSLSISDNKPLTF